MPTLITVLPFALNDTKGNDCVRFVSVLRGHSVFPSPPQRSTASDFEGFLYQILSITLFCYLNSWERVSIFPFECSVLNKGTTGTIYITSLVWRGPWLGIEPGTSRTRCHHSTTRLSRRRWTRLCLCVCYVAGLVPLIC